jgi:hypothetical protein
MGANFQNHPLAGKILVRGWRDHREMARLAKREAILAAIASFPRLREGLKSAGQSWPGLVGMMRHPGFKKALNLIRDRQRAAGALKRNRTARVAVRWELQRAGLPDAVAHEASHQVVAPPQVSHADAAQGII